MELKIINEEQYEQYIELQQNVSVQMRSGLKRMMELTGWTCHYLGLCENDQIVGTAILCGKPMKFAGMFYTCQYGPHLDYTNEEHVRYFFTNLPQVLKKLKATKFAFNPNLVWKQRNADGEVLSTNEYPNLQILKQLGYSHQDPNISTNGQWNMRFHYVKDLCDLTAENLQKSYNSQAKRSVKKGIQNGIEITELEYDQTKHMHELVLMSADKHEFKARDKGYYKRAHDNLKENAKFIVAKLNVEAYVNSKQAEIIEATEKIEQLKGTKKEKQIPDLERKIASLEADVKVIASSDKAIDGELLLSAGVFLVNGTEFIYLFGGNDGQYQKFCSSFVLQDYVMKLAISLGCETYNMYGIEGVFDGSDSVLRFKRSFDGYVNEFIGTYELILNSKKLRRAQLIKKIARR